MTETPETRSGACYCGKVRARVSGAPVSTGWCHCRSCRRWHGAPMIVWGAWASDNVEIVGDVRHSTADPGSERLVCASCGGAVANRKPAWGVTLFYGDFFDGPPLKPDHHVHYGERIYAMADGLPKFVDLPARLGGGGAMAAEPAATGFAET
ncbi:MAG: GFA family protein [Pseudomonadota bacterium]